MLRPPDPEMRGPTTSHRGRANSQSSAFHTQEVTHTQLTAQPLAALIRKVRSLWFLSVEAARTVASLAFGVAAR